MYIGELAVTVARLTATLMCCTDIVYVIYTKPYTNYIYINYGLAIMESKVILTQKKHAGRYIYVFSFRIT